MLRYIVQRLLYTVPILLGVSIVCFALVHLAPGSPIDALTPDGATPEVVAQIEAAYGLDKPIPVQYLYWLSHAVRGDLGNSITTQRPVLDEVLPAMANSLRIAVAAIALSLVLGCAIGALSGTRLNSRLDRLLTGVSVTGISVPPYWLGMLLAVIFAVNLRWLPASGMGDGTGWESIRFMILPALTLSIVPAGIIARSTRAAVAEAVKQDFVQALYAKGLPVSRVYLHVAKNVAPALMAVMGLQFAQLLGGSILVESVFSWPGTGFLLNTAIFTRDLPVLQGTILVLALFFILTNLVVDLLQTLADPRIRRA
ncbi:ABC transporter permease subunit [Bordetella petrii]|nr:ABC transporter permease subunit [Bordetella petrii]